MRRTLTLILATAVLLVPATSSAEWTSTEERNYMVGGTGHAGYVTVGPLAEVHHGVLLFNVTGHDGDRGVYGDARIEIDDATNPNVLAVYSFHASHHIDNPLFGGATDGLTVGTFCTDETLPIPEEARTLRIVLNAPESLSADRCMPKHATAGQITLTLSP